MGDAVPRTRQGELPSSLHVLFIIHQLVMERSQYYDYHENGTRPVPMRSFVTFGELQLFFVISISWFQDHFSTCFLLQFGLELSDSSPFSRLQEDSCWPIRMCAPLECSRSEIVAISSIMVSQKTGPTKEQIKEASFDYFFFGTGWAKGETPESTTPTKKVSQSFLEK